MKDYSRKPYLSRLSYADFIRGTPARAFWNSITEQEPAFSEFGKKGLSSGDRRYLQYLKQSEAKKPYLSDDYQSMEYDWEGLPGLQDGNPHIDHPWMPTPQPTNIDTIISPDVGFWILYANSNDEYCVGKTVDIEVTGTHPIYDIAFQWPNLMDPGTSFVIVSGLGTNSVIISLTVAATETSLMRMEAYEQAFDAPPLPSQQGKGWTAFTLEENEDCIKKYQVIGLRSREAVSVGVYNYVVYDITNNIVATDIPASATPGHFVSFPCLIGDLAYWFSLPEFSFSASSSDFGSPASGFCGTGNIAIKSIYNKAEVDSFVCHDITQTGFIIDTDTTTAYPCVTLPQLGYDGESIDFSYRFVDNVGDCSIADGDKVTDLEEKEQDWFRLTSGTWGDRYVGTFYRYFSTLLTHSDYICDIIGFPPCNGVGSSIDVGDTYNEMTILKHTTFFGENDVLSGTPVWYGDGAGITGSWTVKPTVTMDYYFPGLATVIDSFYARLFDYYANAWTDGSFFRSFVSSWYGRRATYSGAGSLPLATDPRINPDTEPSYVMEYDVIFGAHIDPGSDFNPDIVSRNAGVEAVLKQCLLNSDAALNPRLIQDFETSFALAEYVKT